MVEAGFEYYGIGRSAAVGIAQLLHDETAN
jgi:hypothetical protein